MHATENQAPSHSSASLAQPLRDAADYLNAHGWCQHSLYADNTITPAASVVGALAIACYGYAHPHPFGLPNITAADPAAYSALIIAALILADFIGTSETTDEHGKPVVYTIADWNNEPYQSAAGIIATLRAAAVDYDHGGAA